MQIPDTCDAWRRQMSGGNDERQVLRSIESDPCVPEEVEREFFRRLAATDPVFNPEDAWDAAKRVVRGQDGNPDGPMRFYCTGRPVPENLMLSLVRFVQVRNWDRQLDDLKPERAAQLVSKYGISLSTEPNRWPEGLSYNHRRAFLSDLAREYPTGNLQGITWVADAQELPQNDANLRHFLRCIGLPDFEEHVWVLVLRYNRDDIEGLRVPRCLDGISHWPFSPQVNCEAPTGMTRPMPEAGEGAVGYREAIHRSELIKMRAIELRVIDGNLS